MVSIGQGGEGEKELEARNSLGTTTVATTAPATTGATATTAIGATTGNLVSSTISDMTSASTSMEAPQLQFDTIFWRHETLVPQRDQLSPQICCGRALQFKVLD